MTDRFKEAAKEILLATHPEGDFPYSGAILSSDGLNIIISEETVTACVQALTIAAQSEQLRKERDELAAGLLILRNVLLNLAAHFTWAMLVKKQWL